jgi:glycosyltransferase involved in cell wall biosynthesis
MATILFYTSIKTRVRDQESLMVEFVRRGHKVFFLNQQPNPYLTSICETVGVKYLEIKNISVKSTVLRTFYYCLQLISFIWRNNINVVYSHLEPANFIAVVAQFFVKAKVIVVRHHHDLAELAGFARDFSYRLTYRLARKIIVVSERTKNYMISKEGISEEKIYTVNLGYDFSVFGQADDMKANNIKTQLNGKVKLITVGRLDKYKRPDVSIELLKKLRDSGIKAHLFLLGTGELHNNLIELVTKYQLEAHVEFLGYENDVLTYLKASDWLVHPSISESSCVVVKEAGIVELPVIVCKGVGDFEEYLTNGVDSFIISPSHFCEEAFEIIVRNTNHESNQQLGKAFNQVVISRFHISKVIDRYALFTKD